MKKIILLTSVIAISCQNNVPKCDDAKVTNTIYSIFSENKDKIEDEYGHKPLYFYPNEKIDSENVKLSETVTTYKDSELKSCGCEAKISVADLSNKRVRYEGVIQYIAQSNSEDDIIVKVENVSPLELKFK